MKKINKKKMGRPPIENPQTESLGRVRITTGQLEDYTKQAAKKDKTVSEWVRDALDDAVKRDK